MFANDSSGIVLDIPFWVPQIHDPDWTDLCVILMVSGVPLHRLFCWHRETRNLHPIVFLATVFCDNFKIFIIMRISTWILRWYKALTTMNIDRKMGKIKRIKKKVKTELYVYTKLLQKHYVRVTNY